MAYRLEIFVDEIKYTGQDVGEEFRFKFSVDDKLSTFDLTVPHGTTKDTFQKIFTGAIDADLDVPISVKVTELDYLKDDVGVGQTTVFLDWSTHGHFVLHGQSTEETSFSVNVSGRGFGDEGLTATLDIKLRAVIEPCRAGETIRGKRVEIPNSEEVIGTFETRALTPADNVGQIVLDALDALGDPGGIASTVDNYLQLSSVHASGAYDEWDVYTVQKCNEVWVCDGGILSLTYENCEADIRQRRLRSIQLPPDVDLKDVMVEHLTNIANELAGN